MRAKAIELLKNNRWLKPNGNEWENCTYKFIAVPFMGRN
jgi:hypothetical protein